MQSQGPRMQPQRGVSPKSQHKQEAEPSRPQLCDPKSIDYVLSTVSPDALRTLGEGFRDDLKALQDKVRVVHNRCADTDRLLRERKRGDAVEMLVRAQELSPRAVEAFEAINRTISGKTIDARELGELPRFLGALQRTLAFPHDPKHQLAREVASYQKEKPLRTKLDELLPTVRVPGAARAGGVIGTVEAVYQNEGALSVIVGKTRVRAFADQSVIFDDPSKMGCEVTPAERCFQKPSIGSEVVLFGLSRRDRGREGECLGWMPMRVALDQISKSLQKKAVTAVPSGGTVERPSSAAPKAPEKPDSEFEWDPAL